MKNAMEHPVEKQGGKNIEAIDASKINKTDKNGAYDDSDGRSKNYKGGKDSVNGPDLEKMSKEADGDTSENAGVFK
jgi:hypothetical protein